MRLSYRCAVLSRGQIRGKLSGSNELREVHAPDQDASDELGQRHLSGFEQLSDGAANAGDSRTTEAMVMTAGLAAVLERKDKKDPI